MYLRPHPGWRGAERTGKLADSGHVRLKQIPEVSRHLHGTDARRGPRRSRARSGGQDRVEGDGEPARARLRRGGRSEEHTSELQSPCNLVCRLLLEKKKKN